MRLKSYLQVGAPTPASESIVFEAQPLFISLAIPHAGEIAAGLVLLCPLVPNFEDDQYYFQPGAIGVIK